jgi:hypothetical protein
MDCLRFDVLPEQDTNGDGCYDWMAIRAGKESKFCEDVDFGNDITVAGTINHNGFNPPINNPMCYDAIVKPSAPGDSGYSTVADAVTDGAKSVCVAAGEQVVETGGLNFGTTGTDTPFYLKIMEGACLNFNPPDNAPFVTHLGTGDMTIEGSGEFCYNNGSAGGAQSLFVTQGVNAILTVRDLRFTGPTRPQIFLNGDIDIKAIVLDNLIMDYAESISPTIELGMAVNEDNPNTQKYTIMRNCIFKNANTFNSAMLVYGINVIISNMQSLSPSGLIENRVFIPNPKLVIVENSTMSTLNLISYTDDSLGKLRNIHIHNNKLLGAKSKIMINMPHREKNEGPFVFTGSINNNIVGLDLDVPPTSPDNAIVITGDWQYGIEGSKTSIDKFTINNNQCHSGPLLVTKMYDVSGFIVTNNTFLSRLDGSGVPQPFGIWLQGTKSALGPTPPLVDRTKLTNVVIKNNVIEGIGDILFNGISTFMADVECLNCDGNILGRGRIFFASGDQPENNLLSNCSFDNNKWLIGNITPGDSDLIGGVYLHNASLDTISVSDNINLAFIDIELSNTGQIADPSAFIKHCKFNSNIVSLNQAPGNTTPRPYGIKVLASTPQTEPCDMSNCSFNSNIFDYTYSVNPVIPPPAILPSWSAIYISGNSDKLVVHDCVLSNNNADGAKANGVGYIPKPKNVITLENGTGANLLVGQHCTMTGNNIQVARLGNIIGGGPPVIPAQLQCFLTGNRYIDNTQWDAPEINSGAVALNRND